jgi:hypothetical protein
LFFGIATISCASVATVYEQCTEVLNVHKYARLIYIIILLVPSLTCNKFTPLVSFLTCKYKHMQILNEAPHLQASLVAPHLVEYFHLLACL